jgi:hypothetical protein
MKLTPSQEHFSVSGREAAARRLAGKSLFEMAPDDVQNYRELRNVGLGLDEAAVQRMHSFAMDDAQGGVFTASIGTPVQFLQAWLPGLVRAVFKVRKIDELIGVSTVGSWHDEEVVQGAIESMGDAVPYGDSTPVPTASWNMNFERRTVVRAEKGFLVGKLEEARAGAIRVSSQAEKRIGAATALDIFRNNVGFSGYNSGADRTYGFLNDPYLPSYVTVANGATSGTPAWSTKTALDIIADLIVAFQTLETQSGGNINAKTDETTLVLPTGWDTYLGTPTTLGFSAAGWLKDNYPRCRVETAPQLQAANGSANVFYLYADKVDSDPESTDDSRTFVQMVPARFQSLGVEQKAKGILEDFTCASAGVMVKRPWAVVRYSGI